MQIPSFSVTLTMQEWQAVLGALGEMPFRIAQPLIGKIVEQVEAMRRTAQPQMQPNGAETVGESVEG